jgi:hypothetical protein
MDVFREAVEQEHLTRAGGRAGAYKVLCGFQKTEVHATHLLLQPSTSRTLLKISPARVNSPAASDLQAHDDTEVLWTVGL